ncbi:MAG: hypothetical protein FJZ00_12780 [Candidatus Sericytochromatia bacterium]|uniref:Uncharacterized protein n=1 Tax=Candidatus Tanganyikabacteria bacterium TaxID=2961651 RepID=A0A938BM66_9BACT|nr:hypothetical protein [Candidatus Tanganyikabacteria bacterium]
MARRATKRRAVMQPIVKHHHAGQPEPEHELDRRQDGRQRDTSMGGVAAARHRLQRRHEIVPLAAEANEVANGRLQQRAVSTALGPRSLGYPR